MIERVARALRPRYRDMMRDGRGRLDLPVLLLEVERRFGATPYGSASDATLAMAIRDSAEAYAEGYLHGYVDKRDMGPGEDQLRDWVHVDDYHLRLAWVALLSCLVTFGTTLACVRLLFIR